MKHELERFAAVADNGEQYTVIRYRSTISGTDLSGGSQAVDGLEEYWTSTGLRVSPRKYDPVAFEISRRNQTVRKVG